MSATLNRAQLIGNLGRDPETRSKQDGSTVVTFNLATSESWKDKQTGERVEKVEWHKIVVFNDRLCDLAGKYLRKGSKVFVEGQLKTRKWTDNAGNDRYVTEIHLTTFNGTLTLLDSKRDAEDRTTHREPAAAGGGADNSLDDDVPF
jgi:single-strand DNA-binding protein